jgi:23S rRNA pseudouridine1911/1915/1917 synthase
MVDGKRVDKPAFRVENGASIDIVIPRVTESGLKPLDVSLNVLFEDEHLIVVDKPSGLTMHPGAGNRDTTLANALVAHIGATQLSVGSPDRPGIVHRLDKDTTGLVVAAKSTSVHAALSRQFAERTVGRSYHALVFTTPRAGRAVQKAESGEVSAPIGRHPTDRKRMSVVSTGRAATTRWKVLERLPYGTLLECMLKTGRTHQIRVHMDYIGSPVIGDQTYGDFSSLPKPLREEAARFGRQALHAATLSFTHPVTGERLSFSAPRPVDFEHLLSVFRNVRLG